MKSLIQLGCSWADNIDSRGVEYGGALYNRTSDVRHKEIVRDVFTRLLESDLLVKKTMKQYCSVSDGIVRFLPDRYVEGTCPICSEDGARGDQCDECGSTYDAHELINPISKLDPDAIIEIRDTDHLFFKLDLFQTSLEEHAKLRQDTWKPNVRSMTKNWLNMGLRPRAVTRDIDWVIDLPLGGNEWSSKESTYGLKRYKGTTPAQGYGLKDLLLKTIIRMVIQRGRGGGSGRRRKFTKTHLFHG